MGLRLLLCKGYDHKDPMQLETLDRHSASDWDAYVAHRSDATLYHERAWREAAERAYRLDAPHLVAREKGVVAGVLPLFLAGPPLLRYAVTGLFGAYGKILADTPEIGRALVAEARRIAQAKGARFLLFKALDIEPLLEGAPGFTRADKSVIATLRLAPDSEVLWHRFRDKMRNAIRKSQRQGLEVRWGPCELAPFYDVLAENMHRKGTPIYGLGFMRALLSSLGERGNVITLRKDGRAISGALLVRHKKTLYVPFASSRAAFFRLNPNNLLYWEIIRRGCQEGLAVLDMGRSPRDSSTLAFKLGWNAEVTAEPFYIARLRGDPPGLDAHDPKVEGLCRLWQRLPRPLADRLGPLICRSFLV